MNESFHPCQTRGLQNCGGAADVDQGGLPRRLRLQGADGGNGGAVDDAVDAVAVDGGKQGFEVQDVALDAGHPLSGRPEEVPRDVIQLALRGKGHHGLPGLGQLGGHVDPHEAGAAGDQYAHPPACSPAAFRPAMMPVMNASELLPEFR